MNVVIITGRISGQPNIRELSTGGIMVSYDIVTMVGDVATSVPVALIDPPGAVVGVDMDLVSLVGHVRRRFYRAGGLTQSRTEVVAALMCARDDAHGLDAQRRWVATEMTPEAVPT